jgi:hypothetical protein
LVRSPTSSAPRGGRKLDAVVRTRQAVAEQRLLRELAAAVAAEERPHIGIMWVIEDHLAASGSHNA